MFSSLAEYAVALGMVILGRWVYLNPERFLKIRDGDDSGGSYGRARRWIIKAWGFMLFFAGTYVALMLPLDFLLEKFRLPGSIWLYVAIVLALSAFAGRQFLVRPGQREAPQL